MLTYHGFAVYIAAGYDGSTKLPPRRILKVERASAKDAVQHGVPPADLSKLFGCDSEILVVTFETVVPSELPKDLQDMM